MVGFDLFGTFADQALMEEAQQLIWLLQDALRP